LAKGAIAGDCMLVKLAKVAEAGEGGWDEEKEGPACGDDCGAKEAAFIGSMTEGMPVKIGIEPSEELLFALLRFERCKEVLK